MTYDKNYLECTQKLTYSQFKIYCTEPKTEKIRRKELKAITNAGQKKPFMKSVLREV